MGMLGGRRGRKIKEVRIDVPTSFVFRKISVVVRLFAV